MENTKLLPLGTEQGLEETEYLYTLASYYRDDLREPCFFPTPDWKILPDDELDMRGALHE